MHALSKAEIALRFESLGGGSLEPDNWGYGCEFGFFQHYCGIQPLGLFRWASIAASDLILGLINNFDHFEEPEYIRIINHDDRHWGYIQTLFRARYDHTTMAPGRISEAQALKRVSRHVLLLKRKFLEDLRDGQKIFIYRNFDHQMPEKHIIQLAEAVSAHGGGSLCYVSLDAKCPFTAERVAKNLIMACMDRFSATAGPQGRNIAQNNEGWLKVCSAVLGVA